MANVTGWIQDHKRIDGMLYLCEYVRVDDSRVFCRIKGGKWVEEKDNTNEHGVFKGNRWCTQKTVLEIKSKYRIKL